MAVPKVKMGGFQVPQAVPARSNGRRAPRGSPHVVRAVCGLTNPFCDAAFGTRHPDVSGAITMPFTFHYTIAVTSDTVNAKLFCLFPEWVYGYQSLTAAAGAYTVGNWNLHTTAVAPTDFAYQGRTVSAGFIGRVISNATSTAGYVILRDQTRTSPTDVPLANQIPPSSGGMIIPLTAGTEFSWTSRPLGPEARAFKVASATSEAVGNDWTYGWSELISLNSTTVIVYEVFVHCELMLKTSSPYYALSKPTVASPQLVTAAATVRGDVPSVAHSRSGDLTTHLEDSFWTAATKAVDGFLSDPVGWGEAAFGILGL